MTKKILAALVALAVAVSASTALAGNGPKHQAKNRVSAGTCTKQKAPGRQRLQTGQASGKRFGPGDGTGNKGERPGDGTGHGKKAGVQNGTGECDHAGPHGENKREKNRPSGER